MLLLLWGEDEGSYDCSSIHLSCLSFSATSNFHDFVETPQTCDVYMSYTNVYISFYIVKDCPFRARTSEEQ